MEAVAAASSVAAIIDLSAKIGSLCFAYSKEVTHATESIHALRNQVRNLEIASTSLYELLQGPNKSRFKISMQLQSTIHDSLFELRRLHEVLRPKSAHQAMSRLGLRSLKWPLDKPSVEKSVRNLDQYAHAMSLALQIDTT